MILADIFELRENYKILKRNYISCELHKEYYDMIIDRLNHNGKIKDEFRLDFY